VVVGAGRALTAGLAVPRRDARRTERPRCRRARARGWPSPPKWRPAPPRP